MADSDDIDLLDMLSEEDGTKLAEVEIVPQVPKPIDKDEISDMLSGLFDSKNTGNLGSGDLVQDLINWVGNTDKLPSNPLSSFLANSAIKAEFSMYFLVLSNLSRIKDIGEFIKGAERVLYNPETILQLSPEVLHDRYADANKIMDNLIEHNRKIVYNLNSKKNKNDDELDKLKMLLGAIPTDKLKEIISSLR